MPHEGPGGRSQLLRSVPHVDVVPLTTMHNITRVRHILTFSLSCVEIVICFIALSGKFVPLINYSLYVCELEEGAVQYKAFPLCLDSTQV